MIRLLLSLFRPLAVIARELTLIRELYELDLASRENPVYRITQAASKDDTEVSYTGDEPESPRLVRLRWLTRAEAAEMEPDD